MPKKRIIIAGAGFGGITTTLKLFNLLGKLQDEYEIVLLDRRHHQLYTTALYEIAAAPRKNTSDLNLKSSVLIPLDDIISKKQITVRCDELVSIKPSEKKLILQKNGELAYEFLVLALGSETNYFAIPGLKDFGLPLKTFDDAIRLRNKIEDFLQKKDKLRIVVGGAGSSGVELIAEFVNFICSLKRGAGKNICEVEFMLVEASPEILPGLEPWLIRKTKERLETLGIRIKTEHVITSVTENEIYFKNGNKEFYDVLAWTGGTKGPEILKNCGLPLSEKGAVLIDNYLQIHGQEGNIFAIGDNSTLINQKTGKPLGWNVPVAEAEGRLAAKNIIRIIKGQTLKKFRPLKKYPFVLAVGKKYAIADLVWLRFTGFSGWLVKQLVELRYFLFLLPFGKAIRIWVRGVKYFITNDQQF